MPVGEATVLSAVVSFVERQGLKYTSTAEQHCDKLTIKNGTYTAYVSVYNSGKIVIGGKDSPLYRLLTEMKRAIEDEGSAPQVLLPFEIDAIPETIRSRVPDCDEVILRFVEESLKSYRAGALLAASFMLGAASEKAINLLIASYADSITDETHQQRFRSRINNRMISVRYSEFAQSFKSCKSKPTSPSLAQDLDVKVGMAFQFYRITRNEVGHPEIVPHLDKGQILANIGQFPTYLERLYGLMTYFRDHGVEI